MRKHLSLDGFLGFTFKYGNLPSAEELISFAFDFVAGTQNIGRLVLKTRIVRPIIETVKEDTAKQPQKMLLHNRGSAHALNITLFANSSSKNIKAVLKSVDRHKEIYDSIRKNLTFRDLIMEITGQGSGFIKKLSSLNMNFMLTDSFLIISRFAWEA